MANDNLENLEDKWPQDSDRLFQPGCWQSSARVLTDPRERFYRMPRGYMRAGDLLVEQTLADLSDGKNILYPALFCYRQSIELYLKQLIGDFGPPEPLTASNRRPNHDLIELWIKFKAVLQDRGYLHTLGMSAMETLIQELHDADSGSDGFRYPTTKDGKPFAFGNCDIDLKRLRENMRGIQNFLECADMAMTHDDDAASELLQAYGLP